ncbi:MAG: hypothetical protein KFH98_08825 [Gemmatimonadetes bacterium]|nr:hypothetical protein [Gemmatimonadota bacterium]
MRSDLVNLNSGRWHRFISSDATGPVMELIQVGRPHNKMHVRLSDEWPHLGHRELEELSRDPEVRLWTDDGFVPWRVSAVGPGTEFPYPLKRRHLVFDSDRTWAGIIEFDNDTHLGDLTDLELSRLRDGMRDFGGRRRGYRPPANSSHAHA